MCKVTERIILRVMTALDVGASPEDIVFLLSEEGITDYDAFLAYHAAQVCIRMRAD